MASGSSGRPSNSESKGFDFGSDDILCSSEDYDNHNVNHSDPSITDNSAKEFHNSKMAISSVFPTATYSPPEESSFNQDVISTVEKSMKKHSDNLMRFLEGISSRLSQLELYCYNLDKFIGEMRSDLVRDHAESEARLKSLEKHIQEVHRSVQILRDKQELADTQKELAKLELSKKESASIDSAQKYEEITSPPLSEPKISETLSDKHGQQQLALALPHQVTHPQSSHNVPPQIHPFYMPPPQTPNPPPPTHLYPPPQPQIQDPSGPGPHPTQPQVNPNPQAQSIPPYPQQWAQPQQPVMQPQIRPASQPVNYSYLPNQSMQVPFPGASQPSSGADQMSYRQPPKHLKPGYGDGYGSVGPRPAIPPGNSAYVMHDPPRQPHFQQSAYPSQQGMHSSSNMVVPPQSMPRGHTYNELIEKLVGMGYRGDHVVGVIKGQEKSGEPIDFNAVLDILNGHPSGSSQRGWSG